MRRRSIAAGLGALAVSVTLVAEQGKLVLHVADTGGRPVANLSLATSGAGGGAQATDDTGRVLLLLAPETKAGSSVPLQIVRSPHGHDFVMVSPWEGSARIPPFENDAMNFVSVVVAERGDKALLENGKALAALAAKINQAIAPKTAGKQASEESPKENLEAISKQYGLLPEEVDRAIKAWGKKVTNPVTDPFDAGVALLYEKNYAEATKQLTASLDMREKNLKSAQDEVVEAASFLGQSLYAQGAYRQAAVAQDRALQLIPQDPDLLNAEAVSLYQSGDYAGAEPLYRRGLDIRERALGPDHPDTAASLNNLALLLKAKGNYAEAEPLYRRALGINEKKIGPDNLGTATSLNNLGGLLEDKGDYTGAEPLYRRALSIAEKELGADHPGTAVYLNNLAKLMSQRSDYVHAEPLYRRALKIREKALGPDHPDTAASLNNLAELFQAKGDYADAEPLLRRALNIDEKVLGPDHPQTATDLNNWAELLQVKGDYADAEPLLRRALSIREKAFGPDHPDIAGSLNNLGLLLKTREDYEDAEPLYRRSLEIL